MDTFRKFLVVSDETGRNSGEAFCVDKLAWGDLARLKNLSDYDGVIFNLSVIPAFPTGEESVPTSPLNKAFSAMAWAHIIGNGGRIFVVGRPNVPAIKKLLELRVDYRPLEYRRIVRNNSDAHAAVYRYIDKIPTWDYSFNDCSPSKEWGHVLSARGVGVSQFTIGQTTYATSLVSGLESTSKKKGTVVLLPSLPGDPAESNQYIIREWFGVAINQSEPAWISNLTLPNEAEIKGEIVAKHARISRLQIEISEDEARLARCRSWYGLLYQDGERLESNTQEAFEKLGAKLTRISKEKDDFRLSVSGFPDAILEIKGTHNSKFGLGALRQLAGWIDEAFEEDDQLRRGVFVGNTARKDPPHTRACLFEENGIKFAKTKNFVTIRTVDLFCLIVLQELGQLDVEAFWKQFFSTNGAFDAAAYLGAIPEPYVLREATPRNPTS